MNNRCLITGGAGFIGSHLAEALKEAGYRVTVLDCVEPPATVCLGYGFVKGSVLQKELVEELVADHHYVFHLAALLGVKRSMSDPVGMIENNVLGTMNVLQAAVKSGSKVIFASTSEVYGKAEPPFRETDDLVYGPTTKLRWSYAISKSLEESLCLGYGLKGLPVTVVRYFNVYGPRQKEGAYGGVVPRFIKAALTGEDITVYGDGTQTRSFTFIDDAVRATIAAMDPKANQTIVNIGNSYEMKISQLALLVKNLAGSRSSIIYVPFQQVYPRGFEEIPRRLPDLALSYELLHVQPSVPLFAGLSRTIAWYRERMDQSASGGGRLW
ncbi:NAD-dependent epimerase/dehydratase family protein [Paenibacillus thermotolerans]|uniref:NAD-dependent epimerase/dehydratase family protein n=1 Tax=Paenibacillus thermotolerans TaxID=3027807 RepID=UPI002368919B|nr:MULTISPECIES: NAD-dependent epimerase/dehydratase family protein [unclassified Paenibacillus]